ncbi:uncharacterized protein LOC127851114 [Dreissena polymorpha]|uniref:uncharacterized protein LOC127851114 n=1 Tax=Dreissena polymorpha TaxID=45954 RepID=UPI00226563E5|nr:uncharacterized protein LOC127851114 [Dreissena polymorpha]
MKFKIVNFLFSVYGINLLCGLCSSMTSTETFDASVSTTVPSSSAASTVTIQQPIAVSGSPSSLSSSTYSLPNSSSSISSSRSSLVSSPSSFPSSTSEFTRRPRPSRVSSNPPGVSRTTRTTTPLSTTIWDVVTRIITPNDLPCSILDEVKDINFELKYTPDEVEGVICKCWGVCSAIVLEDEFRAELQNYRYNPFEEDNWRERNIFIALVSVYSLVFIIGCTGNLIAIYGLLRWVKHKTPTFAFIISLSCCDLILLLVCMPIRVTEHFSVITLFIEATCKLSYYVRDFIRVCAVLTLTSISFERQVEVLYFTVSLYGILLYVISFK